MKTKIITSIILCSPLAVYGAGAGVLPADQAAWLAQQTEGQACSPVGEGHMLVCVPVQSGGAGEAPTVQQETDAQAEADEAALGIEFDPVAPASSPTPAVGLTRKSTYAPWYANCPNGRLPRVEFGGGHPRYGNSYSGILSARFLVQFVGHLGTALEASVAGTSRDHPDATPTLTWFSAKTSSDPAVGPNYSSKIFEDCNVGGLWSSRYEATFQVGQELNRKNTCVAYFVGQIHDWGDPGYRNCRACWAPVPHFKSPNIFACWDGSGRARRIF